MANYSTREERQAFYMSENWRNMRSYKLQLTPWCEECIKTGKVTTATEVHHKVDIKVDPTIILELSNLASLCKSCHSSITFKETRKNNKWKRGHLKLRYGLK